MAHRKVGHFCLGKVARCVAMAMGGRVGGGRVDSGPEVVGLWEDRVGCGGGRALVPAVAPGGGGRGGGAGGVGFAGAG